MVSGPAPHLPLEGPRASQTYKTDVIKTLPMGIGQGGTWKHAVISRVSDIRVSMSEGPVSLESTLPSGHVDCSCTAGTIGQRGYPRPSAVLLGHLALCPHPLDGTELSVTQRVCTQRRCRLEPFCKQQLSVMSLVQRTAQNPLIRVLTSLLKGGKWVVLKVHHGGGGPRVSVPHKVGAGLLSNMGVA